MHKMCPKYDVLESGVDEPRACCIWIIVKVSSFDCWKVSEIQFVGLPACGHHGKDHFFVVHLELCAL